MKNTGLALRIWLLLALQICSCAAGAGSQEFVNDYLDEWPGSIGNCTSDSPAPDAASCLSTVQERRLSPPMLSAPGGKDAALRPKPSAQAAPSSSTSEVSEATERIRNYLQVLPAERTRAKDAAGKAKLTDDFTCKDASGVAVAWFVVVKQHASFRYVFATSRSPAFSAAEDFHRSGPVHSTLAQTDEHGRAVLLFAYTSFRATPVQGHQNGILMFGQSRGFWLIHSWRRLFQYFRARLFPDRSSTKGQTFICTTHGAGDLEDIARQLAITKPNPLRWSGSDFLPENSLWRNMTGDSHVTEGATVQQLGGTRKQAFILGEGIRVCHYAKAAFSERDIYSWIAADTAIQGGDNLLKVQAWQSTGAAAPLPVVAIGDHTYTGLSAMTQITDHSKWCVPARNCSEAVADSEKFVCIGDLNMDQASRGGGAMCLFNSVVWQYFSYVAA